VGTQMLSEGIMWHPHFPAKSCVHTITFFTDGIW
jgi:hypothetical protein